MARATGEGEERGNEGRKAWMARGGEAQEKAEVGWGEGVMREGGRGLVALVRLVKGRRGVCQGAAVSELAMQGVMGRCAVSGGANEARNWDIRSGLRGKLEAEAEAGSSAG